MVANGGGQRRASQVDIRKQYEAKRKEEEERLNYSLSPNRALIQRLAGRLQDLGGTTA